MWLVIDLEVQSESRRVFQIVGAADATEQQPDVERIRDICRRCLLEERVAYVVLEE